MSIKNMVGVSRDPARKKAVTVSQRKFFLTGVCTYVTWMSPGVALLAITDIFGKYVHILLNFEMAGLSERMAS